MMADNIAETDDPAKEYGGLEVWNGKKRYVLRNSNGHFVTWRLPRGAERTQTNVAVADGGIEMPEPPEVEMIEVAKEDPNDRTEIRHTFVADLDRGKIKWTAAWDDEERSGHTDRISEKHKAIIFPGDPRINGNKTSGTKLDREDRKQLKADLQKVKQYRKDKYQAEREAELNKQLILTVEEVEYKTGTHRTKYNQSARVLTTNKREVSDEETEQMRALKRELGEANDHPKAGDETPFSDVQDSTEFTVEQAIEFAGAESELAEVRAANERKDRIEEYRNEYPKLRGISFDPDELEEALETAAETGESTTIKKTATHCNDPSLECSTDRISVIVTKNGVEERRTHTF